MNKDKNKSIELGLIRRLLRYTKPYKGLFYRVIFANIILSALVMFRPWLMKITVDDYIITKNLQGLINFSLIIVVILIFEILGNFSVLYYANWIGQSIIRDIRQKLFKKIIGLKMSFFDKSSVGTMVTRTVSDVERISDVFSNGFFEIVSDVLKMLGVLTVMLYTDWKLSLISFVVLPFLLYATRLFQRAMKSAFTEVRGQVSNLNSFVQEHIIGMKIVQLFGREDLEYKRFREINDKHRKAWVKTVWYNSIYFPVTELATSITMGLIVWYGSMEMVSNRKLELGTIIMFIQLSQMLFRPLRHMADKFNNLQMGVVAANRVFSILDTSDNIDNLGKIEGKSFKGEISFENVVFQYVDNQPVINNLSFKAKAGETIAIVGSTGSGKTTIINLINRFYEIDSGRITIDGIDIKDFTLDSLRSQIAIVLQDVFLFTDTIANNISLRKEEVTEEEIIQASKDIGLYDFIKSLPGGLLYNVMERGCMLSSGQKQLIAFLRAYVSNPSILILDEATSSIDTYTEKLIQQATEKITKNRTSIVIAHRLVTIKKASKILVMESGRIVESGTHEDLIVKSNGRYKNLYDAQFKEMEDSL